MAQGKTDKEGVSLNDAQRQFVIPAGGGGFSCLGYDNCFRDAVALAEKLKRPDLAPAEETRGTLANYELRGELIGLAAKVDLGTWFTPGTPARVQSVLESAMRDKTRLKITLGDRESGEIWGDRPESGTIGRSGGTMKVPLLIPTRRSTGGGAILTDCIVRIQTSAGGIELYRHPNLHPKAAAAVEAEPAPAPAP